MTAALVIGLISAIITFIGYVLKRKHSPTREEREEDMRRTYGETLENIRRLRELGRDADADSMLEQLARRMSVDSTAAYDRLNSRGQRVGGEASEGDKD